MSCRHIIALYACIPVIGLAAESITLTLPEAVKMALAQNTTLKLARLKVVENEQKKAGAKADYFPTLKNESNFLHTTALQYILISAGSLGNLPNIGPLPRKDIPINQGLETFETVGTGLEQPLTPLIRIRQENRIAASEISASRYEVKKAETQIALKVHEAYYGILIAQLQKQTADESNMYARARLDEAQQRVRDGSALPLEVLDGKAGLLQSEQSSLTIDLQLSDLNTELDELLGLSLDTRLVLRPVNVTNPAELSREETLRIAFDANPEIRSAVQSVEQAKAALTEAKSAYIPDVSIYARQSYQNNVPFLVHNFGTLGATLKWDVFDFGKRHAAVREREVQLAEAEENVRRLKEEIGVEITQSMNRVERTRKMLQVSFEVVKMREEGQRVTENQFKEGVVLVSVRRQASAANYKAQADLLQAQLAYMLAQAELEQTIGRTPRE
jgi:outer membrane protein TolC